MDFLTPQDIESILEITGLSTDDLASELGVSRVTISNWINNKQDISLKNIDAFYEYAFKKGIRLNKIKEQFYREDMIKGDERLLFHGAKTKIEGNLRTDYSKRINDFGNGFYCGESMEQSAMFVASHKNSSLYMLKFDPSELKFKRFCVDREWMLTIAYFRGRLSGYSHTDTVKNLSETTRDIDYFIAPIADNRMFEIIDSFIDGELTDIQCQHCLSATNLGMQYVFVSEKALSRLTILERCYLAASEKLSYLNARQENFNMNMDKVRLAKKQYRNQGDYIEDIMI